jgi:hypothetical protein
LKNELHYLAIPSLLHPCKLSERTETGAGTVQEVERGLAVFIKRNDLPVDGGVVGQLRYGFYHPGESGR